MKLFWVTLLLSFFSLLLAGAQSGLAPLVSEDRVKRASYHDEMTIPDLPQPYMSSSPRDKNDQLKVGKLGGHDSNESLVFAYARELGRPSADPKFGMTDSLLIAHQGKLVFEAYYRRGRANYPHFQMSITKSYTALVLGRAIQLGHLSMEDLHKPLVSFLPKLNTDKLVQGAESITLHQAMQMRSGIRLPQKRIHQVVTDARQLIGIGQAQAYLQFSSPIPPHPRAYKYQASDPNLTMQVIEAIVPGPAEIFIRDELLKPLGIFNYLWQRDQSHFPKSAAGSSMLSRDMVKFGLLLLNQGKWNGEQLVPAEYLQLAVSPLVQTNKEYFYGYFWWNLTFELEGMKYPMIQGCGAGGQFIFIFPTFELVVVATAHNKGMGNMLKELPGKIVPAFYKK